MANVEKAFLEAWRLQVTLGPEPWWGCEEGATEKVQQQQDL